MGFEAHLIIQDFCEGPDANIPYKISELIRALNYAPYKAQHNVAHLDHQPKEPDNGALSIQSDEKTDGPGSFDPFRFGSELVVPTTPNRETLFALTGVTPFGSDAWVLRNLVATAIRLCDNHFAVYFALCFKVTIPAAVGRYEKLLPCRSRDAFFSLRRS
ncbi:hypothetical protein BDD12DRAFT_802658 [Trichophaea hybrida]|nr:hypothetical protein BDD12DRAFT_802658 [Trichophaea hybrida]